MNLIRTIIANRRVAPGWSMPMAWFAWFGVTMFGLFGLNGWLQNIVLALGSWLTLWLIGLVGTAAIGYDSARNVQRFGYLAIGRPRYYFELARATIAIAFFIWAPAFTFSLLFPNINVPGLDFIRIRQILGALMAFFCIMAIAGYLASFLTGRKRKGRAYECTSWFFCIFGGIALVTFGFVAIPEPPQGVWQAMPGIIACCTGILLLACGILSEASRAKQAEQTASVQKLQNLSPGTSSTASR